MKFELLVAIRYLKAKRKQAVISLITVISVVGVAAGVAALIIALAINAGFRQDLQDKLLGAQAHDRVVRKILARQLVRLAAEDEGADEPFEQRVLAVGALRGSRQAEPERRDAHLGGDRHTDRRHLRTD